MSVAHSDKKHPEPSMTEWTLGETIGKELYIIVAE